MRTRHIVLISLLSLFSFQVEAAVTLPRLISDHMMFQRQMPARVWGKSNPGERVTVTFRSQTPTTNADGNGRWEVVLSPMKVGAAATLLIEAAHTITVRDVL